LGGQAEISLAESIRERDRLTAVSPELLVVLTLSILCGVLGIFLMAHRTIRKMRGGLLYRLSMGLAALGVVLTLNAVARLFVIQEPWPDGLLIAALVILFFIGYSAWNNAHEMGLEG
jgi:ABC-type cobalamin transport system ATPase subunit